MKKLNSRGMFHPIEMLMVALVFVAIGGVYMLVSSKAATLPAYTYKETGAQLALRFGSTRTKLPSGETVAVAKNNSTKNAIGVSIANFSTMTNIYKKYSNSMVKVCATFRVPRGTAVVTLYNLVQYDSSGAKVQKTYKSSSSYSTLCTGQLKVYTNGYSSPGINSVGADTYVKEISVQVGATACVNQTLKQGSNGSCVTNLQNMLRIDTMPNTVANFKVTGTFDTATTNLVKWLQKNRYGITPTGVVDPTIMWRNFCQPIGAGPYKDAAQGQYYYDAGCGTYFAHR